MDSNGERGESGNLDSSGGRLRRMVASDAITVDLVSAFAGDRDMTEAERKQISKQMEARKSLFYSDLLYAISHNYFAPEIAETLWDSVLRHKRSISKALGRNVRIIVATLDYLSNVTSEMISPTLITEAYATDIANLTMRDGMTGLYNHSSCYELLELELRIHQRYGKGVSLIMLDVDNFKAVNDQYGHQEGDRVLVELARTIEAQVRDSDICCRFGGEEFVVILPLTDCPLKAAETAERIRKTAGTIKCGEHRISVSAGVVVCDTEFREAGEFIEQADRALYKAKRDGKNRVVVESAPRNHR